MRQDKITIGSSNVCSCTSQAVKKPISRNVWAKKNSMITSIIQTARSEVQKTGFFLRRQPRVFNKVTLEASERAFPGLIGDFLVTELPHKKRCSCTQEFIRFLSAWVVTASSHTL